MIAPVTMMWTNRTPSRTGARTMETKQSNWFVRMFITRDAATVIAAIYAAFVFGFVAAVIVSEIGRYIGY